VILSSVDGCKEGFREGRFHTWRNFDRSEPFSRIKVVLAALIDDSQVAMFYGVGIGQYSINLVEFKSGWIALVAKAHDEVFCFDLQGYSDEGLLPRSGQFSGAVGHLLRFLDLAQFLVDVGKAVERHSKVGMVVAVRLFRDLQHALPGLRGFRQAAVVLIER